MSDNARSSRGYSPQDRACSEVFLQSPQLEVTLDTASCVLDLDVAADSGCCNVFLQGSMLAIGFQPTILPLPFQDPSCALFVQPDATFAQLGGATTFSFSLPPGLPPFTFYAQGAAVYYTTLTFPAPYSFDFALTPGHLVTLQ